MGDDAGAYAGKIGAGLVNVLFHYADGNVPILHHTAAHTRHLGEQHFIVLFSKMIQPVSLFWKQQVFFKFRLVYSSVVDGNFSESAGIQGVQKFRVIQKHGRFILFSGDAVVDIGKGKGFRV